MERLEGGKLLKYGHWLQWSSCVRYKNAKHPFVGQHTGSEQQHPWTCVQSFRAFPEVCGRFLCVSLHPSKILHLFNHPVSGSRSGQWSQFPIWPSGTGQGPSTAPQGRVPGSICNVDTKCDWNYWRAPLGSRSPVAPVAASNPTSWAFFQHFCVPQYFFCMWCSC